MKRNRLRREQDVPKPELTGMPVGKQVLTDWEIFFTFVGIVIGVFTVVLTLLTGIGIFLSDQPVNGWEVAKRSLENPGYWLICTLIALVAFSSWLADNVGKKDKS